MFNNKSDAGGELLILQNISSMMERYLDPDCDREQRAEYIAHKEEVANRIAELEVMVKLEQGMLDE